MSDTIRIEPQRLHALVDVTTHALGRTRPVLDDHRTARGRLLLAPSDLPVGPHRDLVGPARHDLDQLERLVAGLERLAEAVRRLDRDAAGRIRAADEARIHAEVLDLLDEEWHEWLRERVSQVATWAGRLSELDDLVDDVADLLSRTRVSVRAAIRRTTLVVDEVLEDVVRRTVIELEELQAIVTVRGGFDVAWLRRASPWLRRLGPIGDYATGPLATWEQWDQDDHRDDLTSTERVLRAGTDGLVRGAAQLAVGVGTAALMTGAVALAGPSLGLSLVVGAGAVVGAIAVGEAVDWALAEGLDWLYETEGFGAAADWIDERGRDLRDGWHQAEDWGADRLDELRALPDVAGRAWDGGVALADDVVDDLADRAGGVRDWAGDRVGDLRGALPWP